MKRYLLLVAVTLSTALLFGTSACKKDVPAVPEAGAVADALEAGAAVDAAVAAPELDAGPASPLATAKVVPKAVTSAAPATGGPWQGQYRCFGFMAVNQKGNAVDMRTNPGKTDNFATVSCTANGDVCDGTVTEFKNGAKAGTKGVHITRSATAGDITYKGDGEPKATFCKKN